MRYAKGRVDDPCDGLELYRIVHPNFSEFTFHAIR